MSLPGLGDLTMEVVVRWRRKALEGTFILAEGIAWFMVIALMATSVERAFLHDVEMRIRSAVSTSQVTNPVEALLVADRVAGHAAASAGPSLLLVVVAAVGGFALMRLVQRVDFGAALGSVILVAGTILGVNLLIHGSMGHLQFWDSSGLVEFINNPDAFTADGVDLAGFIADPELDRPHGSAIAVTSLGLMAVWFRFMLAARGSITLDRMARSFTLSFIVVVFVIFVARATGYTAPARWAVPQFAIGMLGLAIGNHERAVPTDQAAHRASPWLTSVGGTIGLLLLSGGLLGMFAYLNAGAVLGALADAVFVVVRVVLVVVLTPIAWGIEKVFAWFFNGRTIQEMFPALPNLALEAPPDAAEEATDDVTVIPPFIVNSLKFFAVALTLYVMYLVGRLLVSRRATTTEAVEETRSTSGGGAGIGQLLADLVRFGRKPDPDAWMDRHPAYALYGRTVHEATERGLPPMPAETPTEFARAARRHLDAESFVPIAEMFERARFGRHFPPDDAMRQAARDLQAWEREHPATDELRESIRGARPMDEADELDLRITLAKRATRGRVDEDPLLGQ
ncbi:MAG: DUF4129 domain-containing protein [Dehalococcoidia bacterium]|nr:DUF4129 domain-containing protein [Dehalococcoidia bacterium]